MVSSVDEASIRVGVAFPFDDSEIDALRALSPRLRLDATPAWEQAAIDELASQDLDGLVGQSLPSDLARTPSLRWLQVLSAGVDALATDNAAGWPARVTLTNARGAYAGRIGQYTIAAVLSIAERHRERAAQQATGAWPDDPDRLVGRSLRGQTIVVVGYGGIGREIGRLAAALGMRVIAVKADPSVRVDSSFRMPGTGDPDGTIPERLVGLADLAAVVREADFVAVTLPLTRASRGLIGRDCIAAMRRHVWLVNTGRGPVIDEAALDAALARGEIAGAVLDVFGEEPLPPTSPFWRRDNVVITPHVSGAGAHAELFALVSENLGRFVRGEPLLNQVDIVRGY